MHINFRGGISHPLTRRESVYCCYLCIRKLKNNLKTKKMNYLRTNIQEIETADELQKIINENENVMVCCGRMGPMCIPVYEIMEELEEEYENVKFYSMGFDNPESVVIRSAPECRNFMGLPFTMYYKNGQVAKATTSIQNMTQVKENLDNHLS